MYEWNLPETWENIASEIAKDLLDQYFFSDTSSFWTGQVNSPNLLDIEGMQAIYWQPDTQQLEKVLTASSSEEEWNNWYDYVAGDNETDSKISKWANAKITKDGVDSYFVWIPRYEYKILSGEGTSEAGPIEVRFIPTTQTTPDEGYKIHPAFTNGTANNFKNGEWDKELPGIWVGKYETSHSDASENSAGNSQNVKIIPGVFRWSNISIGDCYMTAYNYDRTKESHLMKNSEWGACAYLTHSQYGRNGNKISHSSGLLTGNGGEEASSTGNIYGIYDLSGTSWEYTATYIRNNHANLSNGNTFIKSSVATENYETESTKYATVYPCDDTSESSINNFKELKSKSYSYGDAIIETSTGVGNSLSSWFGGFSLFPALDQPFLLRGGAWNNSNGSGCFAYFPWDGGSANADISFRVVLI